MTMAVVLLGYMLDEVSVSPEDRPRTVQAPGPITKTYRAYRAASIPPVLCPITVAL